MNNNMDAVAHEDDDRRSVDAQAIISESERSTTDTSVGQENGSSDTGSISSGELATEPDRSAGTNSTSGGGSGSNGGSTTNNSRGSGQAHKWRRDTAIRCSAR